MGSLDTSGYFNPTTVIEEISKVTRVYSSLVPNNETIVTSNGVRHNFIKLTGTVPVTFRGQSYNIPVKFVFLHEFPRLPPRVFVCPTADMVIKENHPHVQFSTGECFLQTLNSWNFSSHQLQHVVEEMQRVFGQHPPVYAKPPHMRSQNPQSFPQQPAQPVSPFAGPPSSLSVSPNPVDSFAPGSAFRTVPQKPMLPASPFTTLSPPSSNNSSSYPQGAVAVANSTPAPSEPSKLSASPTSSYPSGKLFMNNSLPLTPAALSALPVTNNADYVTPPSLGGSAQPSLKPELRHLLQEKVREEFQRSQHDISQFLRSQQRLNQTYDQLLQLRESLITTTREKLLESISIVEKKEQELDTWLLEHDDLDQPFDLNSCIMPVNEAAERILSLDAEDSAIDDALYVLDRAHASGLIPLSEFLKLTRALSRKQFYCRALSGKLKLEFDTNNSRLR